MARLWSGQELLCHLASLTYSNIFFQIFLLLAVILVTIALPASSQPPPYTLVIINIFLDRYTRSDKKDFRSIIQTNKRAFLFLQKRIRAPGPLSGILQNHPCKTATSLIIVKVGRGRS